MDATETGPSIDDEDAIIRTEDVSVKFPMDRGDSVVVDNTSLNIQRGEILGIVGESGSGKSMFASALLDAVVDPGRTTGNITYYPGDGDSVNVLELTEKELKNLRWEEISFVFQGALDSFNPTMKIRGHFLETLDAHNSPKKVGMERARKLLKDLYLEPERVLDSYPHELSGGMKQRALIALSLVLEPEVLVMDEPTAALDLLMQRSILSLIKLLKQQYDLTIIFITHDLPLVAELADRLAVLYAFQFVEVAPAETIIKDPAHPYTRALLKATPNIAAPLEEMRPIEGSSPDPVNVPSGCSYHPRCPIAREDCSSFEPDREGIGDDHEVACFYWEESADAVPFELGDSE